jgi:ABC-type dipeptide/oligopeptide/nickel transport system permease component
LSQHPWPWDRLHRSVRAVLRWLGTVFGLLAVSTVGVFCLEFLVPGDPAQTILASQLGRQPTLEQIAAKRAELGLDHPFLIRLGDWCAGAWHGDFGRSWAVPGDVGSLIWARIGASAKLGAVAIAVALVLALGGGIGAALFRDRLLDRALRLLAALLACVPAFVLGVLVIQFVVVRGGIGEVLADGSWRAALLPGALLGAGIASAWVRPLRAIALDVLNGEAVRTARARGATWPVIIRAHVLPMTFLEFLPFLGIGVGSILGATAVMEVVFSWPGIGAYATGAALHRDMPVLQAVVLLSVVAFRFGADATRAVGWALDPRRRRSST